MRNLLRFLYYLFYSCVGLITLFVLAVSLVLGSPGDSMLLSAFCLGIMMIVVTKILTHKNRKLLRIGSGKLPVWKPINLLSSFLLFNILMIGNIFYVLNKGEDLAGTAEGTNQFTQILTSVILTGGSLWIWIMHCSIMFHGVGDFIRHFWRFLKNTLWIYLLYRLAIFVFTLVSSVIMIHFNKGNDSLITQGYFLLILEDSLEDNIATGFFSQQGTFMSGLTAASSYFVLSTMALESLMETEIAPLKERFKRMFLEKDTLQLLIMTLLCIFVPLISQENQITVRLLFYAMVVLWILSIFSFLKETRLGPYLFNYMTLTFIEIFISVPEITGTLPVFGFFLAIGLRILLFALVSTMFAYFQYKEGLADNELSEKATILNTGLFLTGLYFGRRKLSKRFMQKTLEKTGITSQK